MEFEKSIEITYSIEIKCHKNELKIGIINLKIILKKSQVKFITLTSLLPTYLQVDISYTELFYLWAWAEGLK